MRLIPIFKPFRLHPACFNSHGKKLPLLDSFITVIQETALLPTAPRIFIVGSVARGTFRTEAEARRLFDIGTKQHHTGEALTPEDRAFLSQFNHDPKLVSADGKVTNKGASTSDIDLLIIANREMIRHLDHYTIRDPLLERLETVAGLSVSLFGGETPERGRCFDILMNRWRFSLYSEYSYAIQPPPF